MKNIISLIFVLSVTLAPAITSAATFRGGDQVSLGGNERVADNLYMAGGTVTSAGPVAGDLLVAGGTLIVSGAVGADLAAAGGNVSILAPIAGDARIAGGTVVVENSIGGDLVVGGGQITVGGPGVRGDTAIGGGTISINAPLAKNLTVRGGSVYIDAPIAGNVTIDATTLTLGSGAVITGDLTYKATKELTQEDGAVVRGQVHFEPKVQAAPTPAPVSADAVFGFFAFAFIGKFLALLVCALVIGLGLRRYSNDLVARATSRPLVELGRGLIAVAAIPVISVLLLVTLVGIPFGVLGLLGFVVLLIFSWILAPIVIGAWVYGYFSKQPYEVSWKTILLGALIYTLFGLVPVVGGLLHALVCLLVLGAVVGFKTEIIRQWK